MKKVKINLHVPLTHSDIVRKAIGESGAGTLGNYTHCSFSSRGIGRFKPNENANPHIGEANKIEEVEEEKVEFICQEDQVKKVIKEIKKVHPYEELALEICPLIDEGDFL